MNDDVVLFGDVDVVVDRISGVSSRRLCDVGVTIGHQNDDLFDFRAIGQRSFLRDQFFNGYSQAAGDVGCCGVQIWPQLRDSRPHRVEVVVEFFLKETRQTGFTASAAASIPAAISTIPAPAVSASIAVAVVSASTVVPSTVVVSASIVIASAAMTRLVAAPVSTSVAVAISDAAAVAVVAPELRAPPFCWPLPRPLLFPAFLAPLRFPRPPKEPPPKPLPLLLLPLF